jgi:hypothetical protein
VEPNKRRYRYGRLVKQLASNYLLGINHYPDTFEKVSRILGNYQVAKLNPNRDQQAGGKEGGLVFIHRGTRARQG